MKITAIKKEKKSYGDSLVYFLMGVRKIRSVDFGGVLHMKKFGNH